VTVGDGVESVGKFTSINAAIAALPAQGGEVCVLAGRYFEHVVIKDRHDIVIHGCGWQTRIASPSLKPAPAPAIAAAPAAPGAAAPAAPAAGGSTGSTLDAVITIARSEHIQLRSFAVEAARQEVGVLVDGTGILSAAAAANAPDAATLRSIIIERVGTVDITLEDLVITASTHPGVLAHAVELLQIEGNRVAMENVRSRWPAMWVSGREIRVVHNWLGIQSKGADHIWLPRTVNADLAADASASSSSSLASFGGVPLHPGGLQIGGPSSDVFVIENEIDGAGRNGITLGSLMVLGSDGKPTRVITGVTIEEPGPCGTTITLTIPGGTIGGGNGGRIVVAGKLLNIQINRNRIRNTGLCGIGPAAFFDVFKTPEIVSVENLTITANTIASTLLAELDLSNDALTAAVTVAGYGAICVSDAENLVIRDNSVTDFGREPGDPACGIFVLHGEMVEISRNRILETRDWTRTQNAPPPDGILGGIVLSVVTPPTFKAVNPYTAAASDLESSKRPVYLPDLPALRVEHNTVRVALGNALAAIGLGPFSIVNNHLATGGTVRKEATSLLPETVLIMNVSRSLESETLAGKFTQLGKAQFTVDSTLARGGGTPGCGAVIFTNNTCQLEARLSGQRATSSIMIFALDDLIFGHNECWLDGRPLTAALDALLAAGSLQCTSNRFQEAAGFPVLASGFTVGGLNITSQNISTYCLFATGVLQPAIASNNLSLFAPQICQRLAKELKLNVAE
jgi:hypothetical protein